MQKKENKIKITKSGNFFGLNPQNQTTPFDRKSH